MLVKNKISILIIITLTVISFLIFIFHPVCVPLSDEDLKNFNVPIEQRTDRDFYLKVFQKKDGQWHQCKTWISRQLFF